SARLKAPGGSPGGAGRARMSYPHHADLVWRHTLEKELDLWCCNHLGLSKDTSWDTLKLQDKDLVGREVMIQHSRRRPELNGLRAEVLEPGDRPGRLTVRVLRPDQQPGRRMCVSTSRLALSRPLSCAGASAVRAKP
ncbi:unnamed protein product, partial [Effrenium voratum]